MPGLHRHLQWSETRTRQVVREAEARKLVSRSGDLLYATSEGRVVADIALIGESE